MTPISEACGGGDAGRALVPGSLRGYRTWRLIGHRAGAKLADGALPLTSVSRRNVRWARTLVARCEPADPGVPGPAPAPSSGEADHHAPAAGCVCGIYGWYDPKDTYMTDARVFGVVEASGLVVMGERGFRAEKATITAVATRNRRLAAACERAGVATYRRRRDLVRDHPPEDTSTLLGDPPPPAAQAADPTRPVLGGFDVFVLSAIWVRALLIAAAFVALPLAPALAAAAVAHVATMGLLVTRIR
jgi:hypothetical protein